jgi:type II secretory pathway pseudopilin PulG
MSLIELMIALVVLAVGVLVVGQIFPSGARSQVKDRLVIGANYYAQEQVEALMGRNWADPMLTDGRHPAGTAVDSLESGRWLRYYQVTTMPGSLNNLKKVDVFVAYRPPTRGARDTVTATTYVRR